MAYFSNQIRVTYGDTDQMGIVYHANYLNYFEISRTEMMRAQGLTYRQLEATGIFLQVVHCELDFHRPAHYDDLLEVRSSISSLGKAQHEAVAVLEHFKLAALSRSSGRIVPLPPELTSAVNQFCVSSDK